MNDSGIIAQYGFLYQRRAFMLYVMKHVGSSQRFIFEGRDDIEIPVNDRVSTINDSNGHYIQAKSGHVNEDCFSRIICNWLLLDDSEFAKFELALEHDLSFDYLSNERALVIYNFILSGKNKKKSAIARKAYDKYKDDEAERVIEKIMFFLNGFQKTVRSTEELDEALSTIFNEHYCSDIVDYEIAKSKRLERFLSEINLSIDESIKNKRPFSLLYNNFVRVITKVTEEISDKKYIVNIKAIKAKFKEHAQKIVRERNTREAKQLYLVGGDEDFVFDGIINELLYKDFRSVYEDQKSLEISNIEEIAKENYKSVKFSLDATENNPKNVYLKTTEKQIESELLPPGPIYRKGCYIYLTGDEIQEDVQITWGEENDSE